jgi:type IV secretion system protein VirB9
MLASISKPLPLATVQDGKSRQTDAARPTNLTVVTDVRIYSFELLGAYPGEASLPYVVRFLYAEPERVALVQPTDAATYHYRLTGSRALRPKTIAVAKDRISVEWAADVALPAIFRIDEDGQETLVNGEMQDGRFVIDGMPEKLVFRLDRLMATAVRVRDRAVRR